MISALHYRLHFIITKRHEQRELIAKKTLKSLNESQCETSIHLIRKRKDKQGNNNNVFCDHSTELYGKVIKLDKLQIINTSIKIVAIRSLKYQDRI